jgi:hypothetical protein
MGQGGEVRGRQSGLIRQSRQIFHNVPFDEIAGTSGRADEVIEWSTGI